MYEQRNNGETKLPTSYVPPHPGTLPPPENGGLSADWRYSISAVGAEKIPTNYAQSEGNATPAKRKAHVIAIKLSILLAIAIAGYLLFVNYYYTDISCL